MVVLLEVVLIVIVDGKRHGCDVIAHNHIGMEPPIVTLTGFKQGFRNGLGCFVSRKKVFAVITTIDNMVAAPSNCTRMDRAINKFNRQSKSGQYFNTILLINPFFLMTGKLHDDSQFPSAHAPGSGLFSQRRA